MPTTTRERRIIAAVDCPRCGAKAGQPCRIHPNSRDATGRPMCHGERRLAWQEWKYRREAGLAERTEPK